MAFVSDPSKGRIISYYGSELQRYTSLQAHPTQEGPVKQFLFHEKGVISLASRSVHLISRRGLTQWHISFVKSCPAKQSRTLLTQCSELSMTDLQCMSFLSKNNGEILVAGCQRDMYKIDVDKGVIVQQVCGPLAPQHTF